MSAPRGSAFFSRRGTVVPEVPDATRQFLFRYGWPGNIRELENELERLRALHGKIQRITPEMFSDRIAGASTQARLDESFLYDAPLAAAISHLEQSRLCRTLLQTNWNKSKSARRLGLSRQGLLKKIERYGISRESIGLPVEEGAS